MRPKILLCLSAIASLFVSLTSFSMDSTNIVLFKQINAGTTRKCVTSLRESENVNIAFADFASQANGGILCDGVYKGTAICTVFTGLGTFSGCGGSSCGWNVSLLSNPWWFGMWLTTVTTQAAHDGCVTTHGNICEGQPNVNVTLWPFTFDTSSENQLVFNASIESGGVSQCTVSVVPGP